MDNAGKLGGPGAFPIICGLGVWFGRQILNLSTVEPSVSVSNSELI